MIEEAIKNRVKEGMRSGRRAEVVALRFLLAQMQNRAKEKQAQGKEPKLSDEEAADVLLKEAKKRKEAIELMAKGGRRDLAEKEEAELRLIEEYLPRQMTRDEIAAKVDELFASGLKDFNSLMREAAKATKWHADGRIVSEIVKEKTRK